MNKYTSIAAVALIVLVASLPVYALLEPGRMERARAGLQQEYLADGAVLYASNCADCHGEVGQGKGAMPALNNPALADADRQLLYYTIAHPPHGSVMSPWHVDEGGVLQEYQVEGLVTLIKSGEWSRVASVINNDLVELPTPAPEADFMAVELSAEMDPHECRACHEEPDVHAERFGLDCSRCHTLKAWKPALLLRHVFFLDHGGEGQLACQTCHIETYSENTCYECHDHQPADMVAVHAREDIEDLTNCAECHPTGVEGEARRLGYGLSDQASLQRDSSGLDSSPGDAVALFGGAGDSTALTR